jgi:methylisocitrate lyase
MRKTTIFRELLAKDGIVVAPAAWDPLSAMIIENTGYKAIFMSGFCFSATALGLPDIGLEGRALVVAQARNIAASIDVPLFIDAGTGYDGPLGTYQTIKELIRAGVAGCFIEDQTSPPICPRIGPPQVVPVNEFLPKIEAVIEAKKDEHDEDFVFIARTDAAARMGTEEAIKRGRAYRDAGADLILVNAGAPQDKKPLQKMINAIGAPNMVSPHFELGLKVADYEEIGVKLLSGTQPFYSAFKAIKDSCLELRNSGSTQSAVDSEEVFKILKLDKWVERAKKYGGFEH